MLDEMPPTLLCPPRRNKAVISTAKMPSRLSQQMIDGAFPFVKGDEILGGQEKMQTWKNHCCKEAAVWIPKKNDSNLSLDRKRAAILFPKPNDGNLDEKQTDVTVPDQFFFPTNNGKVILSSHFLTHQFVQTLGQRLKQKEAVKGSLRLKGALAVIDFDGCTTADKGTSTL